MRPPRDSANLHGARKQSAAIGICADRTSPLLRSMTASGRRCEVPYWAISILIIVSFLLIAIFCAFGYFLFFGPQLHLVLGGTAPQKAKRETWKTVADTKIADDVPLIVYQSKRSKLRVAVASVPGPMVRGVISFVTETDSDDGLPHTLEHLVFMGSRSYPYKGILDVLANLCLASGTNAWTGQDHTAYTLNTVGFQGFLKVLPVYIDHVLDPTLTDAQFMTEVHHVNGKGEDAGVVYSEMQNFESDMAAMVKWARQKAMYPRGSGYSVETGGRLANLRNSTTNDKVRDFHKTFYHLNNMMIIVLGVVDHEELLSTVDHSERHYLSNIPEDFHRPFSSASPPLDESKTIRIETPSDDASTGIVEVVWFGPRAVDYYESSALDVLFDYLKETASSPLSRDFVQLEDPYASSVTVTNIEQEHCALVMDFKGVPVDKLDSVVDRFLHKTLAEHEDESKFDMDRMGFLIKQTLQKALEMMESDPKEVIYTILITHQVYGNQENFGDLAERVNFNETLIKLGAENATFWRDLMQKYFSKPYVCVIGQPSEQMVEVIRERETMRVQDQREELGEEGLRNCEEDINEANHENHENVPNREQIEQVMVKELEDFNDIEVTVTHNLANKDAISPLVQNVPTTAYLHDIPSKFIEVHALIDTAHLPYELRKYLGLYCSTIFQSSAMIDGVITSFKDVAVFATKEIVSQTCERGFGYDYDRLLHVKIKVEAHQISRAAKWLRIYLNEVVFEPDRVAIILSLLASSADERKRDGEIVLQTMHTQMVSREGSNLFLDNLITLQKFHEHLLSRMQNDSAADVMQKLNELRSSIATSPINVHIACDRSLVEGIDSGTAEIWAFLGRPGVPAGKINVVPGESLQEDRFEGGLQRVVALGASESAFLRQSALFPQDWSGDAVVETMLLAQYLSQLEGPLYKGVRGRGLAYTVFVEADPDKNLIFVTMHRCSQVVQAYQATKAIVGDLLANRSVEEFAFEGAKRSLICELYTKRDSIQNSLKESILDVYRNAGDIQHIVKRIWETTPEAMFAKGGPFLEALFDDSKRVRSVVVPPSRIGDVQKNFEGIEVIEFGKLQIE